jgi:hypothetical protein
MPQRVKGQDEGGRKAPSTKIPPSLRSYGAASQISCKVQSTRCWRGKDNLYLLVTDKQKVAR